jgi:hypothetical protein
VVGGSKILCHNTTWYHKPEELDLNLHLRENLKSPTVKVGNNIWRAERYMFTRDSRHAIFREHNYSVHVTWDI